VPLGKPAQALLHVIVEIADQQLCHDSLLIQKIS
jgi:hypothetical protein